MCILFRKHVNNPAPDLSQFNHSFVHHYLITDCSFAVAIAALLKGQCHEICCFWFFSWISFPPAPEYLIRTVSIFSSQGAPPVSTTSVANLPLVSTTLVAICHRHKRHWRQICHRWQIMGTISGCLDLKVNLKAKMYLEINSTSQRCPNKIMKTFMIEDLREFSKNLSWYTQGLGGNWFMKKTRSRKSRDIVTLKGLTGQSTVDRLERVP
jgi:hypothetical protein